MVRQTTCSPTHGTETTKKTGLGIESSGGRTAQDGSNVNELATGAPGMRMHMHFGAEELFFVLSGRPVFRNHHGEEELAPG